ncbi:MAG: hypothetical protein WBE58_09840 [Verrucomicrobiales bacterium]
MNFCIAALENAASIPGWYSMTILAIGISIVVGLIVKARFNAFVALIVAAMVVSLLAPGELSSKVSRVAEALGVNAGKIAIVIGMAAIIGECMMLSGAAQRIVQACLGIFGERRAPLALASSGFVLGIPVFFDTVFYLLVPLARSLFRSTQKRYLLYLLAIAAGGAVTHTLVPPTPGPLAMAGNLGINLGAMMLGGILVGIPTAAAGLAFSVWLDRRMPLEMRALPGEEVLEHDAEVAPPAAPQALPGLFVSLLPILLPVLLISSNTILDHFAKASAKSALVAASPAVQGEAAQKAFLDSYLADSATPLAAWNRYSAVWGNPSLALMLSAFLAAIVYIRQRRPTAKDLERTVETSLMSAGLIILITASGGAFGAMLKEAQIGSAIQSIFNGGDTSGAPLGGMLIMCLAFLLAALLKVAQGSSTVAMITGSSMVAAMIGTTDIGFSKVYLATAIAGGSLIGSWMNDSGFWIFAKMGGLTETEALKSWTPMLIVLGVTAFLTSLLCAALHIPLPG